MSEAEPEAAFPTKEEAYLVFEDGEDIPWWMWPLLAKVTITREQWNIRLRFAVVATSLAFILGAILWGSSGVLIVSVTALLELALGRSAYRYGREKAIERSEQFPRLP